MSTPDWIVILLYIGSLVAIGAVFSSKAKTAAGMFVAARQSPWWLSGISSYMTMFSAGTFVVWGGITYEYGMVGIMICCAYGVSAFFAGRFFAGKWHDTNLSTAAEFVNLRYGRGVFHFLTWYRLLFIFNSGLAIYGLSVMLCPLMPLPDGHLLQDPATGTLSVPLASIILTVIVIAYTMMGGLWAVLVTDTLQFFVLTTCVALVVPLLIIANGGFTPIIAAAPEGFFLPTAPGFSFSFLIGWMILNMFALGAEWSYIQRHLCVPTARDARKAMYLFGWLYLFTPLLWMAPPLIYRTMQAGINPEQAYILACKDVLPVGMVGLMIAAMFSATASSVSTQLNVFAGVLTDDIYSRFRPAAKEKELVTVGRIFTLLLGLYMLAGALILPLLTTYRDFVITLSSLLGPALALPTLFGLFCKNIGPRMVWLTMLVSAGLGVLQKFAFVEGGFFSRMPSMHAVNGFVQTYEREVDIFFGMSIVVAMLVYAQVTGTKRAGWDRLQEAILRKGKEMSGASHASAFPALVMAWCLFGLGVTMLVMILFNASQWILLGLTGTTLLLGGVFFLKASRCAAPREL